jgi:Protein of unknown function (DUF1194)
MTRLGLSVVLVAAMLAEGITHAAAHTVDLALILVIDVSESINTDRFELQRQGYANAFASHKVIEAIAAGENRKIAVTLVEWSGAEHQRQMVGWTLISDAESALAFANAISETPRVFTGWTSISGALDYALTLFDDTGGVTALRRVIDVLGDGINNRGRPVYEARDDVVKSGITINGLPILKNYPTLDAYYRDNVIGGPGSFVVAVNDLDTFGNAILEKLVREIAGTAEPYPTRLADR